MQPCHRLHISASAFGYALAVFASSRQVMRRTVLSRRRSASCQPLRCLAWRWASCLSAFAPSGAHGVRPSRLLSRPEGFGASRLFLARLLFVPMSTSIVFIEDLAVNTSSFMRGLDPALFTHYDANDGQNRALKPQLPGFLPPDDPRPMCLLSHCAVLPPWALMHLL